MPIYTRHTPSITALFGSEESGSKGLARLHAVAAATVLCTGLLHLSDAQALALGRMVVQSPLGEPLQAEVDVLEITKEESESLIVGLGSPAAFKAAGMEFNSALAGVQVTLQRRADGRAFLNITGNRPINEPFVDMVLEANWAAGQVKRDYTLLFDPPKLRQPAPAPLAPAAAAQPTPVQIPAATPAQAVPMPSAAAGATATVSAPKASSPAAPAAQTKSPAPAAPANSDARNDRVRVNRGDTAGEIAEKNLPANVSLDQMLVAMLQSNPRAFIKGNVNRIKAGAVLTMPDQAEATSISDGEARQIISAQSQDFNEFRRRLATRVAQAPEAAAEREVKGQIQAEVKDTKPAQVAQDKLTISKGATTAGPSAEDQIAKDRQAKEAADRTAELARNIDELAKVGSATVAAGVPAAPAATTAPAEAGPTVNAETQAPAEAAAETAPATEVAAAPAEPPEPAATPESVAPPAPPAPEAEELSFIAKLQENPLTLPIGAGLLALLGGFGIFALSRRKKNTGVDSSFLESRLQPDSFFGSSGGQRIDTSEAAASGSSMVYSPSQLDAAGDVDPVAEADVYLAYGRDLQAEEILKEAMRSTPTRVAIHNKLLEIYAKRRDAKAFEVVATEAFSLTQGEGAEWEHACELGKELDPSNPLYQPGGTPAAKPGVPEGHETGATVPFGASTLGEQAGSGSTLGNTPDIDFDLDLDLDQPSQPADISNGGSPLSGMDDLNQTDALTSEPSEETRTDNSAPMGFDLDFPSEPMPLSGSAPLNTAAEAKSSTFDESEAVPDFEMNFDDALAAPEAAKESNKADSGLMAFDLNDIKLDLDDDESPSTETDSLSNEDPLETKLSLAEEFRAIGDMEGARSLAEEVLAEATGALKTKVTTFLNDLS